MSFWRLQFPPKIERNQVELRYHSSKVEFLRSFFGGNRRHQKPFRNYLTFKDSKKQAKTKNKKNQKFFQLHSFLNPFLQLAARKFFGPSYFVTALIRELFFEKYQNSMSVTEILRRDDVNIICKMKLCYEKLCNARKNEVEELQTGHLCYVLLMLCNR